MILLLSDDLMDASKTIAFARAAGVSVIQVKTVEALLQTAEQQSPSCVILDLQCPGLSVAELLRRLKKGDRPPRVIAYGSHVDAARLKAAREAGCDEVMPRSQYFESIPGIVEGGG